MTGTREVSLAFQTDKPLKNYGELARRAEMHGFDAVSVYNDLYFQPSWLPLIEIARATERVRIGPAAVNPFTCHPVHLAGNLALLDEASEGRAYLGVARGAWLKTLGIEPLNGVQGLREALLIIRALLRGDRSGVGGDVFSLEEGYGLRWDVPEREIPFLLGTWGERTLAACRDLVGEVKVGGTASPEVAEAMLARCGKNGPGLVVGAVTVVDEDGARARAVARREVALYVPVVASLDPGLELEPADLQALGEVDALDDRDLERLIPDAVLDRVAFAGTPDQVTAQAERLFRVGVSRIEFGTPHAISKAEGLELLGTSVLPRLREVEAR
ncbi:MAG: LLM class flavin-dependent oxidoreductase [Anaerolineales bacterium]|nr:LLM class flavin-dependent oxidoreductase [Anaerolineales bacterium]